MKFGICTLDEFDLKGKTVLCRVDMNQPVDKATDTLKGTQRIEACAKTVKKCRVQDRMGYVCTGGGALIRFLTGEELPVVKALRYAAGKFGGEK